MSSSPRRKNSVAEQIKYLMETKPESLDNIHYGEIVIKVRDGKCVLMNVNHAFKLDENGVSNGDDQVKPGNTDRRTSG